MQNLSSGFVELSYVGVLTTTPGRQCAGVPNTTHGARTKCAQQNEKLDLSKTKILIFLLLTGLRRQAFAGSVIAYICIYILDIGKITTIDKGKI